MSPALAEMSRDLVGFVTWCLVMTSAVHSAPLNKDRKQLVAVVKQVQLQGRDIGAGEDRTHVPDILPLDMTIEDHELRLYLKRNRRVEPEDVEITYSDGSVDNVTSKIHYGHYQDRQNGAALSVKFEDREIAMEGYLEFDGSMYHVSRMEEEEEERQKTERRFGSAQKGVYHSLTKVNIRENILKKKNSPGKYQEQRHTRVEVEQEPAYLTGATKDHNVTRDPQRRDFQPFDVSEFHVEILFFLDETVYINYENIFGRDKAKMEIRYHYSQLFNAVDFIFRNIQKERAGINIQLWLKGMHVDNVGSFLPYTFPPEDHAHHYEEFADVLVQWRNMEGYAWNSPDHVMYFTRFQIDNTETLGVAVECGVCEPVYAMSVVRDIGFQTWPVAVHELAHNLGAAHDGDFACEPADGYIMTPYNAPLLPETLANAQLFSSCSLQDLKSCMTGDLAWTHGGREGRIDEYVFPRVCTMDAHCSHGETPTSLDRLPGQHLSLDQQCVLATAYPQSSHTACVNNNVCLSLYCSYSDGHCGHVFTAADGTPCGTDQICLHHTCQHASSISQRAVCTDSPFHQVPPGCVDVWPTSLCEEAAIESPSLYFQLEEWFRESCPATMARYGLHREGETPCTGYVNAESSCGEKEVQCPNGECVQELGACDVAPEVCDAKQFQCRSGECIELSKQCDGKSDCPDASDEENCEGKCTDEDQYTCNNGQCIESTRKCDRQADCLDGTDEDNCQYNCQESQFMCKDGRCIESGWQCDGEYDCLDKTDEEHCEYECQEDEVMCRDGQCIPPDWQCDGDYDCLDRSDEENCDADCQEEFACGNGDCVPMSWQCDHDMDCKDGSDEKDCPSACQEDQFMCSNGLCIDSNWRCDDIFDCWDETDEQDCPIDCTVDEHRCGNGECIDDSRVCDGRKDCKDSSDESDCPACPDGQFQCSSGDCIFSSWQCDGEYDCLDETDESDCPCPDGKFQCDGERCIDPDWQCDGEKDCSNGSDEENCPFVCQENQFQCRDGQCIPLDWLCD